MNSMMMIFALAVTVEALVEYGKSIGRAFTGGGWKKAVPQLAAVAAGVALCLTADADLYATAGLAFAYPWLGRMLTGIFISRGANYVSDFVQKLLQKGETSQ